MPTPEGRRTRTTPSPLPQISARDAGMGALARHHKDVTIRVATIRAQEGGENLSPQELARRIAAELAAGTGRTREVTEAMIGATLRTLRQLGFVAPEPTFVEQKERRVQGEPLFADLEIRAAAAEEMRRHPLTGQPSEPSHEKEAATIVARVRNGEPVHVIADLFGMTPREVRALVAEARQTD